MQAQTVSPIDLNAYAHSSASHGWSHSPFSVPIVLFIAWFGVVSIKTVMSYMEKRLRSQELIAAMERGIPLPPDPALDEKAAAGASFFQGMPGAGAFNLTRRISRLRTGGIFCVSAGVGNMLFFAALAAILRETTVLVGAAVGLIPLAIGVGLLIDAAIQRKSLAETPAPPHQQ